MEVNIVKDVNELRFEIRRGENVIYLSRTIDEIESIRIYGGPTCCQCSGGSIKINGILMVESEVTLSSDIDIFRQIEDD